MSEQAQSTAYATAETRARRRIRKAVESRSHRLATLEWEPWYDAGEKSGIGGGWCGTTEDPFLPNTTSGNEFYGLSVEETLAHLDSFMEPPESCACDRPRFYRSTGPNKTQLHLRGMHDEGCRWFLRYRLPWWDMYDAALTAPAAQDGTPRA